MNNCAEYDANNGYNYTTFFNLNEINHNNTDPNIINLKIGVLASKDAHILLSDKLYPTTNDLVYEFVLGAGSNTFCEIRKKLKKNPLRPAIPCKLFKSSINPVLINIIIKNSGRISIFVIGSQIPLIEADDLEPVAVKYVSFGSWGNAESKWFYDCKFDFNDGTKLVLEAQDHVIRRKIMESPWITMREFPIDITIEMSLLDADYITKYNRMKVRCEFTLKWFDSYLSWNSTENNNISSFRDTIQGWKPIQMFLLK